MLRESTLYPEEEVSYGLRTGQVEVQHVKTRHGGYHILIKTYQQTDEEAGGRNETRKAMLPYMEGDTYYHNGVSGIYKNVGQCEKAPKEFAIRTLLIINQSEFLDALGDWDYEILVEKSMQDNLDLVTDGETGLKTDLKPFRIRKKDFAHIFEVI